MAGNCDDNSGNTPKPLSLSQHFANGKKHNPFQIDWLQRAMAK